MNHPVSALARNLDEVISESITSSPSPDQQTILCIAAALNVEPWDVTTLISLVSNPNHRPVFDGTHDEAAFYDRNIQAPRLTIALDAHWDCFSLSDEHRENCQQTINSYVTNHKSHLKCLSFQEETA